MKRDRLGHTVDSEVAQNVAALRPRLFYASALERDLRIFVDVKKFRAAQMIVSLFDPRIDAAHVNLCRHRGILRMLAVDVDLTIELGEFSVRSPQKLMHTETDRRACRIEPVCLVRQYVGTQADDCDYSDKIRQFHFEFSFVLFFASVASVFKSGVRESGNRPNKFPKAKAGSAFSFFSSCTPAIRASSVSKCETARAVGSVVSR